MLCFTRAGNFALRRCVEQEPAVGRLRSWDGHPGVASRWEHVRRRSSTAKAIFQRTTGGRCALQKPSARSVRQGSGVAQSGVASRDAMSALQEAAGNACWLSSQCPGCIADGFRPSHIGSAGRSASRRLATRGDEFVEIAEGPPLLPRFTPAGNFALCRCVQVRCRGLQIDYLKGSDQGPQAHEDAKEQRNCRQHFRR